MVRIPVVTARPLTVALACLALSSSVVLAPWTREDRPQEKLEERVKKLEDAVAGHAALLRLQDERIVQLEGTLDRVERWRQEVPRVMSRLLEALGRTRDQGFTRAGANVDARESLMGGLEALARDLPKVPETTPSPR